MALFAYGDDGGRRFTVVLTGAEDAPGPGGPNVIGFTAFHRCFTTSVGQVQEW